MQTLKTINKLSFYLENNKPLIRIFKLIEKSTDLIKIKFNENSLTFDFFDNFETRRFILNYSNINFIEYYIKDKEEVIINIKEFNLILKRIKKESVVSFEFNDKFIIKIRDNFKTSTFYLNKGYEIEEDKREVKELVYKNNIEIEAKTINSIIRDLDKGDSVYFELFKDNLKIYQKNYNDKINNFYELKEEVKIINPYLYEKLISKYSIEFLKECIKSNITEKINIRLMNDYPLEIEYKETDRFMFEINIIPRINN